MNTVAIWRLRGALSIAAVGMLLTAQTPGPPLPAPTRIELADITAFADVTDGDLLVVARYIVEYPDDAIPAVSARESMIPVLKGPDGVIGHGEIAPYRTGGYGHGVLSVYVPSAPSIEAGESWHLTIQGNPTLFASPLPFADENAVNAAPASLIVLVRRFAALLADEWDEQLVDPVNHEQLSTAGLEYFQDAIPGILTVAAGLAIVGTDPPVFGEPTPRASGYALDAEQRYDNVFWVGTAFDEWSVLTGLPSAMLKSLVLLAASVFITAIAGAKFGAIGAMGAMALSFSVGLPIALSQGFAPWSVGMFIIGAVGVIATLKLVKGAA